MKKTGDNKLKAEQKKLRREIQRKLRRAYWDYLNGIFSENSQQGENNKRFWSYIKHQKSSNVGISPLKKED